MAEFTMCSNPYDCKIKHLCRRFLAKVTDQQAYSDFYQEGQNCQDFYPVEGY